MGQTRWPWCFLEVWHTQHSSSSSLWQKSLSDSRCVGHRSNGLAETLGEDGGVFRPFCSCTRVSQTFLSTRLTVGSVSEHLFLHTGHSRLADFLLQNWLRQVRQKLWLQRSTTGSAKISQHTGQDNWSSTAVRELAVKARGRIGDNTLGLRSTPDCPGWEEALSRKGIARFNRLDKVNDLRRRSHKDQQMKIFSW